MMLLLLLLLLSLLLLVVIFEYVTEQATQPRLALFRWVKESQPWVRPTTKGLLLLHTTTTMYDNMGKPAFW